MGMPTIKIQRYSTTGGTEDAPPVGKFWAGYIEPENKQWILYIKEDGTPFFFGSRDPETGACTEPPISVRVNGEECTSRHCMGDEVRVEFNPTMGKFLIGTICGVTFTDYGKVLYDVRFEVPDLTNETPGGGTIIRNVDSAFVSPLSEEGATGVPCCERDWDKDGNCDRHASPGVPRHPLIKVTLDTDEEALLEELERETRYAQVPTERLTRFPVRKEVEVQGEWREIPLTFRNRSQGGMLPMIDPETGVKSYPPRETQANFDLDKLAEIWPEKYGQMAQALRDAVSERSGEGCSGLPDGRS